MAKKGGDPEALKKNLFWILLGVFGVFWLVAVIVVKASGSEEPKKKYDAAASDLKSVKGAGIKTEKFLEPWAAHGKKFNDHKQIIWKDAWNQQQVIYTWPENMRARAPKYTDDPFAADAAGNKIEQEDQSVRLRYRNNDYADQFVGLDTHCYPAEFYGGFDAVFPKQVWDRSRAPTAEEIWLAQEDFWIRRELLDIVRETLNTIAVFKEIDPDAPPAKQPDPKPADAGKEKEKDKPAEKDKEKPAEKPKDKDSPKEKEAPKAKDKPKDKPKETAKAAPKMKRVFRNANWEVVLIFEPRPGSSGFQISDASTIKNINPQQRTQFLAHPRNAGGLPFRLLQNRGAASSYEDIQIAGEPLPYEAVTTLKQKFKVERIDLKEPFTLIQVLDWEFSPVRRIDKLELGLHSHRTVTMGLKENPELKKLDPEAAVDPNAAAMTGGMTGMMGGGSMPPMGGSMPPMGGMMMGMMGGGNAAGGAPTDATSVNKIPRKRYLQFTPQARHLPVGMRLIVDQSHIPDLLTAVSNSLLRIQITQVSLVHVTNVSRAAIPAGGNMAGGVPGMMAGGMIGVPGMMIGSGPRGRGPDDGVMPGGPLPGGLEGGMRGRLGGLGGGAPFMPGNPPTGAPAESTSKFVDNARLVEVSVYGIATLYDRFPAKPKKDAPK